MKKVLYLSVFISLSAFAGNVAVDVIINYLNNFNPLESYEAGEVSFVEDKSLSGNANWVFGRTYQNTNVKSKFTIKIVKSHDEIPWKQEYTEGYEKSSKIAVASLFPLSKYSNETVDRHDKVIIVNNFLVHYTSDPIPDIEEQKFKKEVNATAQILLNPLSTKKAGVLVNIQAKNISVEDFLIIINALDLGKIQHNIFAGE
jgi:hypothetical protein